MHKDTSFWHKSWAFRGNFRRKSIGCEWFGPDSPPCLPHDWEAIRDIWPKFVVRGTRYALHTNVLASAERRILRPYFGSSEGVTYTPLPQGENSAHRALKCNRKLCLESTFYTPLHRPMYSVYSVISYSVFLCENRDFVNTIKLNNIIYIFLEIYYFTHLSFWLTEYWVHWLRTQSYIIDFVIVTTI